MSVFKYAVFGNPVAHSKSPQIHQHFARQEGAIIEYVRIFAENNPSAFQAAMSAFFRDGGCGANVTLPFKGEGFAYSWVDSHSERARAAGAVNTVIPQADGSFLGDNTDGIGLVYDLTQNLGLSLAGKNILLLGAGGATRGVVLPLKDRQPESITIANRTHDKALELAARFDVAALPLNALGSKRYDIIINATSGSVSNEIPDISFDIFSDCLLAYDMFYGCEPTDFLRFAHAHGAAATADGIGMLVGQAAESYRLWRGFTPDIASVVDALRAEAD